MARWRNKEFKTNKDFSLGIIFCKVNDMAILITGHMKIPGQLIFMAIDKIEWIFKNIEKLSKTKTLKSKASKYHKKQQRVKSKYLIQFTISFRSN